MNDYIPDSIDDCDVLLSASTCGKVTDTLYLKMQEVWEDGSHGFYAVE